MTEVTYKPQDGDPAVIREHGLVFEAGKSTKVPEDHPKHHKIVNNPAFEVKGKKAEKPEDVNPELEADPAIFAARAELDKRGVKWHHKSGLAKLQQQIADHDNGVKEGK